VSNNPVENEFDAYRESYSDEVTKAISYSGLDVDFFTRAKAERLVSLIDRHVGSPKEISALDVGCGVGNFHALLANRFGKISGVDPSSGCIAEAMKRNPDIPYVVSDGDVLPFRGGLFDVTFAICVMHHVPPEKWGLFLSEMARVTRPDGMVLIFEHNPLNPLVRKVVSNCPFDKNAVLLRKRTLTRYMNEAGLKKVFGRYILTVPSISGWFRTVDDSLGFLPSGAQYFVAGFCPSIGRGMDSK
jgi:ubiquinone/menaquinone biosynthesis C-methylase UbiE